MKKIIKILVSIASVIGLVALIKHLFFKDKVDVLEIPINDNKEEVKEEDIQE